MNWLGVLEGAIAGIMASIGGYLADKNYQSPDHKWTWSKSLPSVILMAIVGAVYGGKGQLSDFQTAIANSSGLIGIGLSVELGWKVLFRRAINPAFGGVITNILSGLANKIGGNSGSNQPPKA